MLLTSGAPNGIVRIGVAKPLPLPEPASCGSETNPSSIFGWRERRKRKRRWWHVVKNNVDSTFWKKEMKQQIIKGRKGYWIRSCFVRTKMKINESLDTIRRYMLCWMISGGLDHLNFRWESWNGEGRNDDVHLKGFTTAVDAASPVASYEMLLFHTLYIP